MATASTPAPSPESDGAAEPPEARHPGLSSAELEALRALEYEQARDELAAAVQRLEAGGLTLEESLTLWERGEALAAHCQALLDNARARLDAAAGARQG